VEAPSTVSNYLLNDKRDVLQKIEVENNIRIKININDTVHAGYETFIINNRKALEEEEKRDSISKERKERSHSKVGGDKFKKVQKISWKFGDGTIEAKELPLATQEILNEHFYDITGQKPPVTEEPVSITPTPSNPNNLNAQNNHNNQNNPNHPSYIENSRNPKNKKFKKKYESPEETFDYLPENFTSFEETFPEAEAPEAFETFSEVIAPIIEEPTVVNKIEEENLEASESIAPPNSSSIKIETIFNTIQIDSAIPTKGIVDIKIDKTPNQNEQEKFQSFEVEETPVKNDTAIISTSLIIVETPKENINLTRDVEKATPIIPEVQSTQGVQFLDLSHTSRNFGLGLTFTQPIPEPTYQSSTSPVLTESISTAEVTKTDDFKFQVDDDENDANGNQSEIEVESNGKPGNQNSEQNREGKGKGNRPFARRRRRFQGQKGNHNGQRPPPKNNI
jgi:hypothetical protein